MWWTIPLVMLLLFIFVGIPLILEYRAEGKEYSLKKQNDEKNIFIEQGEKFMNNTCGIFK